jgi:hypothetical protein
MSYLDSISFQFFGAKIWEATPIGNLTLRQFLDVHREPKDSTVEVIEQIKIAAKNNDLKLKDNLKQNNLYSFVPSVILDGGGRAYSNIVDFNPIMICEFDKIDHAKELKERLFNNLKCVVAAWISPSGRGLKLLIRIRKPESVEAYKEYYCGLAYYLSQYEGFDGVNFNIVLPLFLSYDRDILVREDAEEWVQKGGKINAFQVYEGEFEVPEDIEDEIKDKIIDKITYLVRQIDDNAHPKIRNIATIFGGFCSQYGFNIDEADDLICVLINDNLYMQKNPRGYCKTAKEFLRKGFLSPIEIS